MVAIVPPVYRTTAHVFHYRVIRKCVHVNPLRFISSHTFKMPKPSPFCAKIDSVSDLPHGKWISTKEIAYTDPAGNSRKWEMAVRNTRNTVAPAGEPNVDAVSIVALLRDSEDESYQPRILVVKQFRPPTALVVLEFPAGLVDPGEGIASTAERELVEETGYHGKFTHYSRMLFSDPGLTNANMVLAYLDVDVNDDRNKSPEPDLQDGEFIETTMLLLASLKSEIESLMEKEECTVDARLFHFAEGLHLARELQLCNT